MGKIVWLASYPNSGNTWLRAFLHNYITQPDSPHSIDKLADFSVPEAAAAFFHKPGEALTTEAPQRLRPQVPAHLTTLHADLVFAKTHNANLAIHNIPLCTPEQTAGAIYIIRDPRDAALSYAAFLGKSVDEIITFMASQGAANRANSQQVFEYLASWSTHITSWASAKTTFLVRYEDLRADPTKHFGRIIHFLGGDPEPARLQRAIEFSAFDELAAQERNNGYQAGGPGHAPFFRTGQTGQWREHLTQAQITRLEADHGPVMKKYGYL